MTEAISCGVTINSNGTNQLYINGKLVLQNGDHLKVLANSNLIMGPGASIEIYSGAILEVDQSIITGCPNMWHRILVRSNGFLKLSNSSISQGHQAIELQDGARFEIVNNNFLDNYISIFSDYSFLPKKFGNPATVAGNDIEYDSGFLPTYPGQPVMVNNRAFAGIWLRDVSAMTIGHAQSENHLSELTYGIIGDHANLTIVNTRFTDIDRYGYQPASAAVHAESQNGQQWFLKFTGMGKNSTPTMNRCRTGFFISTVNTDIQQCKATDLQSGIYVQRNAERFFRVSNNDIQAQRCIRSSNNTSAPLIHNWKVANNRLEVDLGSASLFGLLPSREALSMQFTHVFTSKGKAGISDNHILLDGGVSDGYAGYANRGLLCEDNLTDIYTEDRARAYYDFGGSDVGDQFVGNTIIDYTGGEDHYGFLSFSAMKNNYYCNQIDSTEYGIVFVGFNKDANLGSNFLGSHDVGLDLKAAGSQEANIGPQANTMNNWLSSTAYGTAAARHYSNLMEVTQLSKIEVHTTANPYWPDPLVDPSGTWFKQQGTAGNVCQVEAPTDWPSKRTLTWADGRVLQDSLDAYSEEDVWLLRYSLVQKLESNPDLLSSDSTANNWYQHGDQDQLRTLYGIENRIWTEMAGMDTITIDDLLERTQHGQQVLGRIHAIDTIRSVQVDSLTLVERDSLLDVMADIQAVDLTLWSMVSSFRDSLREELIDELDSFTPEHAYESYLKDVYLVVLSIRDSLGFRPDSASLVVLDSIAGLCIGIGGPAVGIARGVYLGYVDTLWDDEVLCSTQAQMNESSEGVPLARASIHVRPNPAKGVVFLTGVRSAGWFRMHDTSGRVVRNLQLNSLEGAEIAVDLTGLLPGLYYWTWDGIDQKNRQRGSLVIH
ncbi:MAG: right-handed parallel beta-helix repeat-containing protein [Saprospiraceae bacterium]